MDSARADASRETAFQRDLRQFVGRCQSIVMAVERGERSLDDVARELAAALPASHSRAEFLLLRSVLTEFVARALEIAHPNAPVTVLPIMRVTQLSDLKAKFLRCLSAPMSSRSARFASVQRLRARRAMSLIADRCCEPTVSLDSVAAEVGVSPQYLVKLLRSEYGYGFRAALRRARVQVARPLLEQSLSSIKEIAVKTGYGSTSQFDRDFRRECRTTPGAYRLGQRVRTKTYFSR